MTEADAVYAFFAAFVVAALLTPLTARLARRVGAGDIAYEPFFCGLDTSQHHFIMENDDAAQAEGGSWGDAERSYDYMASLRERSISTPRFTVNNI